MGFAFGVLFVIFGGGYYLIRYLIDSGSKEASDAIYKHDKQSTDNFAKLVCSDELEREISILYQDKCYSSIEAKAWSFAKNEEWFDKLSLFSIKDIVYRAGYGKLRYFDAVTGINLRNIKLNDKVKCVEGGEAKGQMMLWVVDQLKKHGVNTKIVVKSFDGRYRYLTKEHPYDYDDETYIFEQSLSSYTKKKTIKDTYPEKEKQY